MTRRTALLLLALFACKGDRDRAVDPVWGKQPCAHCAMLVTRSATAAQLVAKDGERRYFDDIGCMAAWVKEHGEVPKMWVRSPNDDGWVDARTAHYRTDAKTPMDYGFIAAPAGITWSELRARVDARKDK